MALAAVYGATILKVLPQLTTPKVFPLLHRSGHLAFSGIKSGIMASYLEMV